ncbi:MAG: ABC transporter [Thermoprotei archaeon]|nr:MAG: ABC transporter [Thermoprotei archaeon]
MIELVEVHAGYDGEEVLHGISCVFDSKHLLLGPNGSGKTTLIKVITGLVPIDSGRVVIDGKDLRSIYGEPGLVATNVEDVYAMLGVSVRDLARLFMDLTGGDLDQALAMFEEFGLKPRDINRRKLWELSAGQRKIVTSVLALCSCAKHVVLDEPFEQLDPARKALLLKKITEYRGTIIISTHETWLIPALRTWSAYLMFEGRVYGRIDVEKLQRSKLVPNRVEEALLTFTISGREFSIVETGEGKALTDLITLDRVYELAMEVSS